MENIGNGTARNVIITHNVRGIDLSIYPPLEYETIDIPQNREQIRIKSLSPKSRYIINYLYFPPLLWSNIHAGISCDEGGAKEINIKINRLLPDWHIGVLVLLTLTGLTFALKKLSTIFLRF